MISVYLHGYLGEEFTKEKIEVNGKDVRDVMSLLISRFGVKFRNVIEEGAWHLIQGKKDNEEVVEEDNFLSEELLEFPFQEDDLHLFPAIIGAGGKGVGRIILGIVLIIIAIVAWYFAPAIAGAIGGGVTASQVAGAAVSLAVAGVLSVAGGVMAMMTKTPTMGDYNSSSSADPRPSFIFNGVVNNTEQGVPVPLVYGRHLTGSTIIYAGMDVEQL